MNLIRFLFRTSPKTILASALVGMICGIASAWLITLINDYLSSRISDLTLPSYRPYLAMGLLTICSAMISEVLLARLSAQMGYRLRLHVCTHILAMPLAHLESIGKARLTAVLTQDIPAICVAIVLLPTLFANLTIILACLVYLGHLSPWVLTALVVFMVFAFFTYILFERMAFRHIQRQREGMDALLSQFEALIHGIKELKLHDARRNTFMSDLLWDTADKLRHHAIRHGAAYAFTGNWVNMLYFIFIGLLLFLLPHFNQMTVGTITGFTLVVLYIRNPITALVNSVPSLRNAMVSFEKMLTSNLPMDHGAFRGQMRRPEITMAQPMPFSRITLQGVTHNFYREQEERQFKLGPINLEIRAGELLFLIGGNGSGKTTLAKLITGLYRPTSGQILVDDEPVNEDILGAYRQQFSTVFTDFYIFSDLMGMDDQGTDLDTRANLLLSKLQLAHKVTIQNGRLSTTRLSTGQRKRLALLTAFLEDRPFYLFDEWAADQDPEFRDVFYNHLLPELKASGKTVFIISHDDRYFSIADRLIKMVDGYIENIQYYSRSHQTAMIESKISTSDPFKG